MRHPLPLLVPLALVCACGADAQDTASKAILDDEAADCGGPVLDLAPGLSVACETGDCALVLVDAAPMPADRGDNTWTLQLTDAAGAPRDGASVVLSPFMPAHDHGTVPADHPAAHVDGLWVAGPFDLFMPGRWELRVAVDLGDDGGDGEDALHEAVFAFCVEG